MMHFVILCMGRTGSTLLVDLLRSHSEIECQGEIFGPAEGYVQHPGLTRGEYLDGPAYRTDRPIKGFKMPFDWVLMHPGIFDDLKSRNYHAIMLGRMNALDHFISARLADLNTDWGSFQSYAMEELRVNPFEFMSFVGYRNCAVNALEKMWGERPCHSVMYEGIFSEDAQREILDFLSARQTGLTTTTTRARTKKDASEVVTNYDELVEFFKLSPYAGWFPPRPQAS